MYLSIVIPAYNEESKIIRDLEAAKAFLTKQTYSSEVIIVNDGSQDQTKQVVEAAIPGLSTDKITFRLCSYEANRGKGYAVRYGVLHAKAENVAFVDAGLCVPYDCLERGLQKIEDGADYAIASRRLPQTQIKEEQPLYRKVGSQVFWCVVQGIMRVKVSDTQCGFKVYTARAAKKIFSVLKTDGFMFDIEALIVAEKLGLTPAEFPVEWSNDSDTRYHPVWGTIRNFKELLRIRLRTFGGPYG
jgi:dolichyl-phosphate beta-glucosyltransferase